MLNKAKERANSQIQAMCNSVRPRSNYNREAKDNRFFEDKLNEKNNQLFASNAKYNELEVRFGQVKAEKEQMETVKVALVEKEEKLKVVLKERDELLAKSVELNETNKKLSEEIHAKEITLAALESEVLKQGNELLELKSIDVDALGAQGGFIGFSEADKLRAIEDLVKFQGKSMEIMTESFRAVVQEVKAIRSDLARAPSTAARAARPEYPPLGQTKMAFAEAIMKRNSAVVRTRNIIINDGEDEALVDQIRKDTAFNDISIDRVNVQAKRINVTLSDPAEAARFESLFKEKYKDRAQVIKPKELTPKFKIVNVPEELNEEELRKKLCECNKWIPEGGLNLDREYSSIPRRKTFVYECSANLLSVVLKKEKVRVDMSEFRCFEDFELLQCFKCCKFGHSFNTCKGIMTCKICAGEHHHGQCPNKSRPCCANCRQEENVTGVRMNYNHRATAGTCEVRRRRSQAVIASLIRA